MPRSPERAGLDRVREFALALPEATEEPHFEMTSFRVRGKIFATAPADEEHLHVFVDDGEVSACVAEDPAAFEPLRWGTKVRGVRISLVLAPADRVFELIEESWRRKAPRTVIAAFDAAIGTELP
jgi:hypothetical protein